MKEVERISLKHDGSAGIVKIAPWQLVGMYLLSRLMNFGSGHQKVQDEEGGEVVGLKIKSLGNFNKRPKMACHPLVGQYLSLIHVLIV